MTWHVLVSDRNDSIRSCQAERVNRGRFRLREELYTFGGTVDHSEDTIGILLMRSCDIVHTRLLSNNIKLRR